MKEKLIRLVNSYRHQGLVVAGELLLPPDIALRFADDLEAVGVVILGGDGWHYE